MPRCHTTHRRIKPFVHTHGHHAHISTHEGARHSITHRPALQEVNNTERKEEEETRSRTCFTQLYKTASENRLPSVASKGRLDTRVLRRPTAWRTITFWVGRFRFSLCVRIVVPMRRAPSGDLRGDINDLRIPRHRVPALLGHQKYARSPPRPILCGA